MAFKFYSNAFFLFFLKDYYPNMFMSVPNGPQTNPQFQNKPPYNFNNNNAAYDDQNKDYSNYNPQGQIKIPGIFLAKNIN